MTSHKPLVQIQTKVLRDFNVHASGVCKSTFILGPALKGPWGVVKRVGICNGVPFTVILVLI